MGALAVIETSTPRASLAGFIDGEACFEEEFVSDRRHHSALFAPLGRLLAALGDKPLDEVLVGSGPGSYSGTRVGIAAAQGLALARGCAAVGACSLLGLGASDGLAVGDARRGGAWRARLGEGLPRHELVELDELRHQLAKEPGPVIALEDVAALDLGVAIERREPRASELGRAWLALSKGERAACREQPPEPVYLRPPHVTEAKPGHPLLRRR